ncbi:MAG: isocitrate/isopropylmalate dehydrogenase family protein [Halobacteriaceae archaeon]
MYEIPVLPGDGIGPAVLNAGQRVLERAATEHDFRIEWHEQPYGAEHYLETGETLPTPALEELQEYDAIYFGSVGDPRVEPGVLERGIVLRLRFALDQYVNLRPIRLLPGVESPLRDVTPQDIDIQVIRENTEDFYAGLGARVAGSGASQHHLDRALYDATFDVDIATGTSELSYGIGIASRAGTERVLRYGFERAAAAGHDRVTVVDKANVMPELYGLWRDVAREVANDFEQRLEFRYADAAAMDLVRDPGRYETIVTPNLFGDILTDLGAIIQGGLGLCPGANLAPGGTGLFEPMHGSAPDIAGDGVANPIGAIWAGAMLLDHLGESAASQAVEAAIADVLAAGSPRTPDLGGTAGTATVADAIADRL